MSPSASTSEGATRAFAKADTPHRVSKGVETKMSMTWFATLAAGVLACVGLGGILTAVALKDPCRRKRSFRLGTYGLTLGGLVLMLGSIAGWLGSSEMFGGLLMVVFGTGSALLPTKASKAKIPDLGVH